MKSAGFIRRMVVLCWLDLDLDILKKRTEPLCGGSLGVCRIYNFIARKFEFRSDFKIDSLPQIAKFEASISLLEASSELMQASGTTKQKAIFIALLAVLLMSAEWILLVAGTRLHEMIVGVASVLASGAFLFAVHRHSTLHTDFRAFDMAKGWRIPWYVVNDILVITAVLFKDLFAIEKAKSLFRVSGFQTAKNDPALVARRVLAIAYTSASPNTIVLGIDYTCSRMLFHQLKRAPLPQMTDDLGAKS